MKKTALVIMVVFALSIMLFPCRAATQEKYVYDLAGILTAEQISEIENAAEKYFGDSYASVYIVTDPTGKVKYYGEDFIADYPQASKNSVILIITDNFQHNYNLYTYGKCNRLISNSEVDLILDDPDVYNNIKISQDYVAASLRFLELASEASRPQYLKAVLLGVFSALVVSAVTGLCIVLCYNRKSRSEKYPLSKYAKLELVRKDDILTGTFVTKRVIQRPSSGSGRTGGSGRIGGGGGRGHRGGR